MTDSTPFTIAKWKINPDESTISDRAGVHRLDSIAMAVLCQLAFEGGPNGTNHGLVTREQLIADVWPERAGKDTGTSHDLTSAISRLRAVFGDDSKHPQMIETVRRQGYRLLVPALIDKHETVRAPAAHAISVLPIADYSAEPVTHFALGLTELLISELARHSSLRVISRTSVMHYLDSRLSLPRIAEELGVQFIVEASTDRIGNVASSTIQVIDAETDHHIWVDRVSSEMGELHQTFAEVASRIAGAIAAFVEPSHAQPVVPEVKATRRTKPEAIDAYFRGRQLWGLRSLDGFLQAIDAFSLALRLDPDHVPSWCGISDTYATMALYELEAPRDVFPAATEASRRAIQIDSHSPDALRSLAAIQLLWQWKWPEAESNLRRALDLNPSDPMAHLALANLFSWSRRADESILQIEKAQQLDPFNPGMNMNVGDMLFGAGQFAAALRQYEKTLVMAPHLPILYLRMARACRALGAIERGLELLDRGISVSQNQEFFMLERAAVAAVGNDPEYSLRLLNQRIGSREHHAALVEIAAVYALLGRNDDAFDWLESALEERSPVVLMLEVIPDFSSLKSDLRWEGLRDRVRFGTAFSRERVSTDVETGEMDDVVLDAGVGGDRLQDPSSLEVANSLDELVAGGSPMTAPIIRQLLNRFQPHSSKTGDDSATDVNVGLSERETEVLGLIAKGCSFPDIADLLHVSKHTVRTHVRRMYRKLEVNSKNAAVYEAVNLGIIKLN